MAMLVGMMLAAVGAALIGKVLRDAFWQSNTVEEDCQFPNQVIEINDYEILDENRK